MVFVVEGNIMGWGRYLLFGYWDPKETYRTSDFGLLEAWYPWPRPRLLDGFKN